MVGIALLTLVPGELGGSESATRELLRALARDGTLPYRVYLPPAAPGSGEGLPSEVVPAYRLARTLPARLAAMSLAAARPGPIRRALAAADLVHYPLTIRIPPLEVPGVVTLHDLQHLDLPALFPRAERAFRALAYHRSARSAAIVVCPSAFVAGRAVTLLGLDPGAVRVVHHGIDHDRFSPDGGPREEFVLYPARRWPHKNHLVLFEAFAQLRRARPRLRLVLTGGGRFEALPAGVEARDDAAPRRSSTPRSTRASGSRRSRRWPADARLRARTPPPYRRSAGTRRASLPPGIRTRSPRRSRRSSPIRLPGAPAASPGRPPSPGRARQPPTKRSTASFSDRSGARAGRGSPARRR